MKQNVQQKIQKKTYIKLCKEICRHLNLNDLIVNKKKSKTNYQNHASI